MLKSGSATRPYTAIALFASLLAATRPAIPAAESGPKPWTVDDILRLRDVSDPQISPDGRWVAFVVSEADYDENALDTDVYLAALPQRETAPIPLT
ncbi:MAG: hypothetical protein HY510_06385, partial [Acidobacteria bacterium]|nr:hypothetical protein [Acidobacteriota bacterium]